MSSRPVSSSGAPPSSSARRRKSKKQLEAEAEEQRKQQQQREEQERIQREEEEKEAKLAHFHQQEAARSALRSFHPLDSSDFLSLSDLLAFCIPPSLFFPHSRGRLFLLAQVGPLVHRHSFHTCLCSSCKERIKEKRKENETAKAVWEGKQFTIGNIVHFQRHNKREEEEKEGKPEEKENGNEEPFMETVKANGNPSFSSSFSFSSSTSAPFSSSSSSSSALSSTLTRFPPLSSPSRSFSSPSSSRSSSFSSSSCSPPLLYSSLLPFLCSSCVLHLCCIPHLSSGFCGRTIVNEATIRQLSEELEERELLLAYGYNDNLTREEGKSFIVKLDKERRERAVEPINRKEIMELMKGLKKVEKSEYWSVEMKEGEIVYRFEEVRERIEEYRRRERERLGQMYNDVEKKGRKEVKGIRNLWEEERREEQIPYEAAMLTRKLIEKAYSKGEKGRKPEEEEEEKKGGGGGGRKKREGKLILRKNKGLPAQSSHLLHSRLLHANTHKIMELSEGEGKRDQLLLNVYMMRNTMPSDKEMGWKS